MESERKYKIGLGISIALTGLSLPTVIGPVIFGLLAIGIYARLKEEQHGERPWWTKSFVTLWRERGESEE